MPWAHDCNRLCNSLSQQTLFFLLCNSSQSRIKHIKFLIFLFNSPAIQSTQQFQITDSSSASPDRPCVSPNANSFNSIHHYKHNKPAQLRASSAVPSHQGCSARPFLLRASASTNQRRSTKAKPSSELLTAPKPEPVLDLLGLSISLEAVVG